MKLKLITEAARYQQTPGQNCHLCMAPFDITVEGVRKLLSNLNPYKAVGADIIHPRVLKELSSVIAPALCNIFRASLQFIVVPSDWKRAYITPISKRGPSNCRKITDQCDFHVIVVRSWIIFYFQILYVTLKVNIY